MKYLLHMTAFCAFSLLVGNAPMLFAQDEVEIESIEHDGDEDRVEGSITINGRRIEFDTKEFESWMEENAEQFEDWVEENAEHFEAWAERHASEWEEWAEGFEEKMEKWAEGAEKDFERWAEQYSGEWEEWAEQLESGEIDADEMGDLIKENLSMLSDMPLGELIEGAMKEGLGGLEDAPFESLGELNEIVGGALEQSLRAMEGEIAGITAAEMKRQLGDLEMEDMQGALEKLQSAIAAKQKNLDSNAKEKLQKLEKLLANSDELGDEEKSAVMKALKKELMQANESEKKNAKNKAVSAYKKAIEMKKRHLDNAEMKRAKAAEKRAMAKKKAAKENAKEEVEVDKLEMKESLREQFEVLKQYKAVLEGKESEIETMRREIRELRKEVEKMKKQTKKKGSGRS